MQVLP